MDDDPFAVFDDVQPTPKPMEAPALARCTDHPHFKVCRDVWPASSAPAGGGAVNDGTDDQEICRLIAKYAASHAGPCAQSLRKSRITYGRACGKALVAACDSIRAGNNVDIDKQAARTCVDLCSLAIEEQNWDVPAWQEANLLALGIMLLADLSIAPPRRKEEEEEEKQQLLQRAEAIGKSAIGVFNLAVAAACSLLEPPEWMPWVGRLLAHAEAHANAAFRLRQRPLESPAGGPSQGDVWRIPTAIPTHSGVPTVDPSRRVDECAASALSPATFFCDFLQKGNPLLIRGHLASEEWHALEYFGDLRALHASAGDRLVPINLGSPLVGYGGVVHWPLRRLIEEHLLPSNATHGAPPPDGAARDEERHCSVAYCSQHHLLHQHPALQSLLAVPPYTLGRELSPTNIWIGTRGTVTSLHSDPSDNLLCQVAGFKYYRLYGLDQTPKLYATTQRSSNTNSFGTSPVRVELEPLADEYAAFADAQYVEGILAPGDMLFIPKSHWHYVRSLTTSVSINFWF